MTEEFTTVCPSSDRARWLEERRTGLGSSDAPAILGLVPWASPLSVYADKLGLLEDVEASEAMRWGQRLEPVILQAFAEETGREVAPAGVLVRSVKRPWQLATCDGVQQDPARGPGIVEVKATGFRAGEWEDGVPAFVNAQVQHQLAVTGDTWASVVVLIRGCKLLHADVERDDRFIDDVLLPELEGFWRRVEAREPVAADASEATKRALSALYPRHSQIVVPLPGELVDVDAELQEVKERMKADEARRNYLENQLRLAIGDALGGVLANGVTYTHKLQKRAAHEVKESEFRVLRRVRA